MNALLGLLLFAAAPSHVIDEAGVLQRASRDRLESELADFQKRWGVEVDVITEDSLDGLSPDDRTAILGSKWGVGDHTRDQGVVVGFFRYDRRMAINLSKGVHGITPADCKRIIDGVMLPRFRNGAYEEGLSLGALAVEQVLQGKPINTVSYTPTTTRYSPASFQCTSVPLLVGLIVLVVILRAVVFPGSYYYGRGYGWGSGWSSWSSGSSWGGSSWSGSSGSSWGGSSSTFSGGGWSGGGASGSW